jgi:iron complex transport system substrate-binding protein
MKVVSSKETRTFAEIANAMAARTGLDTIPAVQQDHVFFFSSNVAYDPKSYIGLVSTAKVLHPELFKDLDPHRMLDDYADRYVAGTHASVAIYPAMAG